MYIKVNKTAAKKLLRNGYTIRVLPCNVKFKNLFFEPFEIDMAWLEANEMTFETFVNHYMYYNCNAELGKYPAYFLYGNFTMGCNCDRCYGYKEAIRMYEEMEKEHKDFMEWR